MPGVPTLHDLAVALSPEERRDLRRRILKSLSLHEDKQQRVYAGELKREDREESIRADMNRMTLWDRIRFFFRRLFSSRKEEDIFVDLRLKSIRDGLRHGDGALVDRDVEHISPVVAREVYGLYLATAPLYRVFRDMWKEDDFFEDMVASLIESRIPDARRSLGDFATTKEMQDLVLAQQGKAEVKRLVLDRLGKYFESIQADIFNHLELGLLPLYFLRALCLFSFRPFFAAFGTAIEDFTPDGAASGTYPEFKPAPASTVVGYLEELHYALYTARRGAQSRDIHPELIRYYVARKSGMQAGGDLDPDRSAGPEAAGEGTSPSAESAEPREADARRTDAPPPEADRPDVADTSSGPGVEAPPNDGEAAPPEEADAGAVRRILDAVRNLWRAIDHFSAGLSLADLIRVARRDPYYRLMAYIPRLNLREFYYAALKVRILSQLDARFPDVRMGVIGRTIDAMFPEGLIEFTYYRSSLHATIRKLGLPTFRYVKSLNVLYNYILVYFRPRVHPMIRNVTRLLPGRLRDAANRLILHASALDDLAEEIVAYDRSFSPDSGDGKALMRMRAALEHDSGQQRSYRVLVAHKDREAKNMLDRGSEHIEGMASTIGKMDLAAGRRGRPDAEEGPEEKESAARSRERNLQTVLEQEAQALEMLGKLIAQLVTMEQGG